MARKLVQEYMESGILFLKCLSLYYCIMWTLEDQGHVRLCSELDSYLGGKIRVVVSLSRELLLHGAEDIRTYRCVPFVRLRVHVEIVSLAVGHLLGRHK